MSTSYAVIVLLNTLHSLLFCFFFSSRRRHTRCLSDWSSDVCSSDLSTGDMLNVWTNIKRGVEQFRAVKRADPPRGDIKKAKALVTRLADGDGRAAPMAPDHSTRKNWLLATATRSRSSDTPRRNAVRASGEAEAGAGTGARALQLGEPTKPPASG